MKKTRGKKWFVLLLVALVAVFGGKWYLRWQEQRTKAGEQAKQIFAKVEEGPLVINLTESGSIKPREQLVIKSQVEGRVSILFIVPEGQRVKEGDLLVELDSSTQKDNLVNQEITVQNAQASHVQAVENLEVVKNQAKADVDKAELDLRFAKEDLIKYQEGEYPKTLNELESRVTLAAEELERAQYKLEWSKTLYEEKYLSETEFRSDKLAGKRYELELKTAQNNLALSKNYTYKRQVAQLESDVSQRSMALERIQRSSRANVVQAEAQLRARELELNRQKSKLVKIQEQIEKSQIYAPADGLVIYATSSRGPWRSNTQPLEEGQEVFERQELIYLPTADTFNAEIKVHETNLKKIFIGLPVRIRIDALPGRVFLGKITKVAPLPDAQSMFMNPDLKIYNTTVSIDGGDGVLKSGMNCEAEIIIEQYTKAMFVPVQCVVRAAGTPVVYVRQGDSVERRDVEIGMDNNRMVRILSGLKVGDEVLVTPPLHEAVSLRASEEVVDMKIPTREEAENNEAARQAANNRRRPHNGGGADVAAPGAGAAENGAPAAGSRREGGRRRFENMSAEEREAMRKRFESMTPEEREAMGRRMREQRGDGTAPAGDGTEGGERRRRPRRSEGGGADAAPPPPDGAAVPPPDGAAVPPPVQP
ncbi:MAG: efflux RND transporter periplasmic adaptor subunit [Lentisphaeria bacterium]|nr:efflux RND transporter periplasmic adaptor subunit [Lentisphaeria bacterium]